MKPKKRSDLVAVRLPLGLRAALDKAALAEKSSVSALIRKAISGYLSGKDKGNGFW